LLGIEPKTFTLKRILLLPYCSIWNFTSVTL